MSDREALAERLALMSREELIAAVLRLTPVGTADTDDVCAYDGDGDGDGGSTGDTKVSSTHDPGVDHLPSLSPLTGVLVEGISTRIAETKYDTAEEQSLCGQVYRNDAGQRAEGKADEKDDSGAKPIRLVSGYDSDLSHHDLNGGEEGPVDLNGDGYRYAKEGGGRNNNHDRSDRSDSDTHDTNRVSHPSYHPQENLNYYYLSITKNTTDDNHINNNDSKRSNNSKSTIHDTNTNDNRHVGKEIKQNHSANNAGHRQSRDNRYDYAIEGYGKNADIGEENHSVRSIEHTNSINNSNSTRNIDRRHTQHVHNAHNHNSRNSATNINIMNNKNMKISYNNNINNNLDLKRDDVRNTNTNNDSRNVSRDVSSYARDWNAEFQQLTSSLTDEKILSEEHTFLKLSELAHDFVFAAKTLGK